MMTETMMIVMIDIQMLGMKAILMMMLMVMMSILMMMMRRRRKKRVMMMVVISSAEVARWVCMQLGHTTGGTPSINITAHWTRVTPTLRTSGVPGMA